MFTVTFFVERSTEVVLSGMRSRGADSLDAAITIQKNRIATAANETEKQKLIVKLETIKIERTTYRSQSRRLAIFIGVAWGLVVAFAGVRALGTLTDTAGLVEPQVKYFRWIDIFLTGVMLAGGSDQFNKFSKAFASVMQRTSEYKQPKTGDEQNGKPDSH